MRKLRHQIARTSRGYVRLRRNGRMVMEHVLVAETALGHALPDGTVVHHVNGKRDDNRPSNLVVCQDQAYHFLLHAREKALLACGNPDLRECKFCHEWCHPAGMTERRGTWHHLACAAAWQREYRKAHPRQSRLVGGLPARGTATHCRRGHPWNEDNTHINRAGSRVCRACDRARTAGQRGQP